MKKVTTATAIACIAAQGLVPIDSVSAQDKSLEAVVYATDQCYEGADVRTTGIGSVLLGLLIPFVIEQGVKGLGEGLKSLGSDKDRHIFNSQDMMLYTALSVDHDGNIISDQPIEDQAEIVDTLELEFSKPCLVAAFGPPSSSVLEQRRTRNTSIGPSVHGVESIDAAETLSAASTSPVSDQNFDELSADLTNDLAEVMDLSRTTIVVAQIESSPDRTAFKIVPKLIESRGAFDGRAKDRSVNVTFGFNPPTAVPAGDAAAMRTFSLSPHSGAFVVTAEQAHGLASGWLPLPAMPEEMKARLAAARQRIADRDALVRAIELLQPDPNGDPKVEAEKKSSLEKAEQDYSVVVDAIYRDIQDLREFAPYSFRADMHETRRGSKFLRNLGEFLTGKSEDIAKGVAPFIDPSARQAAAEAEIQTIKGLRVTAITQAAAYSKATAEGDELTALAARIQFEDACRQLRDQGFAEVVCSTI